MPVTKQRRFPYQNGQPRYLRVFEDDRAELERYVAFFVGTADYEGTGRTPYLALSEHGTGYHGEIEDYQIDTAATYEALGKEISFAALPEDCQAAVLVDYRQFWS